LFRKLLIPLVVALPWCLFAQVSIVQPDLRLRVVTVSLYSSADTLIPLPHSFLVHESERLILDSLRTLRRGLDYEFKSISGTITLRSTFIQETLRDGRRHTLTVEYLQHPFFLKPTYSLRALQPRQDTLLTKIVRAASDRTALPAGDIIGPGLQRSGSIIRGLSVGSNRDLTLASGFRLQLSGNIAPGLDVVAALTDENVPIQPEGTTQTLQELDKVFVELRNPFFNATLGDFVYQVPERVGGEFTAFSRKLQGATGSATFRNVLGEGSLLDVSTTGGTARGKFTTNQFQGIEGNQGPYRLSGEDPGRRPVIIAGTERVYINGQLMTRGETNDYTIDYTTGEITFSPRRMVTSATRISVDFQYSDRQFVRNLLGVAASVAAFKNTLKISTSFSQEADDYDSPVEMALDDTLRSIIASSGRSRFGAAVTGIRFAGIDTTTRLPRGQYVRRDTIIDGRLRSFFVYAPGDPMALYSVVFSYVDRVPADSLGYQKSTAGGFSVAGLGKGSYLPLQFLPVPELRRVAGARAELLPVPELVISGELALSERDMNRLAPGNVALQSGSAHKLEASYKPRNVTIGGANVGDLELRLVERFVDSRFTSFDRFNEVEFARDWNLTSADAGDEQLGEASIAIRTPADVNVRGSYGVLRRSGSIRSSKWSVEGSYQDSSGVAASVGSDILSTESPMQNSTSSWSRYRGNVAANVWYLRPSLRIEAEDRRQRSAGTDSLAPGSFRFLELSPGLTILKASPLMITGEVQFRTEDSASHGLLHRAFRSVTQLYDVRLQEWNSFSSSIALSVRRTDLSEHFARVGDGSTKTVLARSQSRYTPLRRALDLDVLYEFARERSAPMKRVFVRVPKGTGNYVYKGDENQNGLPDESEFVQTRFDGDFVAVYVADESLVPVSEVKTGARLRVTPRRFIGQTDDFVSRIVNALSSETVVRIEERGTDDNPANLYLLRMSRFLNDSTTISGTQLFTQDIYVNESDPSLSLRFRFNERRSLLRLVGNAEHGMLRERSIRLRSQLLKEIGNQTDFTNKTDRLATAAASPRQRDISSDELRTEFSYRPYSEWELAFGIGVSRIRNRTSVGVAEADLNDELIRLTYSLKGGGQLRGEMQREEAQVQGVGSLSDAPYEFTNGRVIGKTYQWRLAFDYRISQYVQVSVAYDGRLEGTRSTVHTGRAEARAFF